MFLGIFQHNLSKVVDMTGKQKSYSPSVSLHVAESVEKMIEACKFYCILLFGVKPCQSSTPKMGLVFSK